MSETIATTTIPQLPLDSLNQVFTYDGDFVATISVVYAGKTYRQTFTNDGTHITSISPWTVVP